jgi:hypothetical protein
MQAEEVEAVLLLAVVEDLAAAVTAHKRDTMGLLPVQTQAAVVVALWRRLRHKLAVMAGLE